jgi:hypothetical protein
MATDGTSPRYMVLQNDRQRRKHDPRSRGTEEEIEAVRELQRKFLDEDRNECLAKLRRGSSAAVKHCSKPPRSRAQKATVSARKVSAIHGGSCAERGLQRYPKRYSPSASGHHANAGDRQSVR